MRIRQCVLDGEVQSHRNLQCLMGSGKGGFCHRFCLIAYMDDLSVNLKECQSGCIAGGTIVNHLMYADDIVGETGGHWDIFHILLNIWTLRNNMHA